MDEDEILGTTKITHSYRISLLAAVREAIDEDVDIGDRLVYRREGDRVVIEPATDQPTDDEPRRSMPTNLSR